MDAAALGYTKVGAMVTFNFGNGISYGGSLEGFIQSFEGSNIIYTMEMKVPQKEIAFGRFTIGAVVFNNSFPLREGELGLTNPMNTRRIPYYLGDISEVNGGMVDPPYTDIIDPFEVRVVSYR